MQLYTLFLLIFILNTITCSSDYYYYITEDDDKPDDYIGSGVHRKMLTSNTDSNYYDETTTSWHIALTST